MEVIRVSDLDPTCEAVVVDLDEAGGLSETGALIDRALGGQLADLFRRGEFSTKIGDYAVVHATNPQVPRLVIVVGIGPRSAVGPSDAFKAAGAGVKYLSSKQRGTIALAFPRSWDSRLWEAALTGAITASSGQDLYRRQKKLLHAERVHVIGAPMGCEVRGKSIGNAVNWTRNLVNQPPNQMHPVALADAAIQMASRLGLECEIWDVERLRRENCHALLAVASGSQAEPRLIILRYRGNGNENPDVALVGKGVTFDSGGLSIKPTESMKDMKCDMAGAASVLGAMQAAAEMRIPRHVVGLIGAVENMLGGGAYKLGDVITTRNGKTIEILNTDAEGRVVLADVLDVATGLRPAKILDLATLTGACMVALGTETTGMMTNQAAWGQRVLDAAGRAGEPMWQLPMFESFGEQIRSQIADIKNVGEGRWGGAITAAKFLQEFVRDLPWVHLDIAGPAYSESPRAWRDAGATGVPVRSLIELLLDTGW